MNDFFLIFRARIKIMTKTLATAGGLRIASFAFVISTFLAGSYYVFFKIFNYLAGVEVIGLALMGKVVEMVFFVFFLMLLFSNIITSFSTFFNDKELNFLFSLPVRAAAIFLTKLIESCLYASWATVIVALPLTIAYGVTTKAGFFFYPFSIFGLFIYLIIPASIASILIFFILRLFPRIKPRDVILISLVMICGLTILYVKISNPTVLKIFETESEQELLQFATNLTTLSGIYVPSTWLSNILKGLSTGSNQGFFFFSVLFFVSLSTAIIAFFVAWLLYAQSWLRIGEHTKTLTRRRSILWAPAPSVNKTLLFKDLLVFIREPAQWVQLSIFVILLIVYIFSLKRTPFYFTFPLWRTIVSFANFGYISFVIATLGVRFIYPALSLERSGIWIIGSSPMTFKRTVLVKYLFNLVLGVTIIESLLIFSNILIHTDPQIYGFMPLFAFFIAASLVSINLGFGCRFPQFTEDNPSKIAAGSGGIIAALASTTYVGISIIILATSAYDYLVSQHLGRPVNNLIIYSGLFLFFVFNVVTIILPLHFGIKSLERRDF